MTSAWRSVLVCSALALALGGLGGCFKPALEPERDGELEVEVEGDAANELTEHDGDEEDARLPEAEVALEVDAREDVAHDVAVAPLDAPRNVSASTDRQGDVEVRWDAVERATGYLVRRCPVEDAVCEGSLLGGGAVLETRLIDTTALAPGAPGAPDGLVAVGEASAVALVWQEVEASPSPAYRYVVSAVGERGEGARAEPVVGARASRPIVGYQVRVDGAEWVEVGQVDGWRHVDAAAPTLSKPVASASEGTYAEFVRLASAGVSVGAAAEHRYEVRAMTEYGAGAFAEVRGRRVAGAIGYQWERSVGASAEGFEALVGASGLAWDDAGAPADGGVRWYRLRAEAEGVEAVWSEAVAGARQPPPGVPATVRATTDQSDAVVLSWSAVAGALGYHVYRDGVKLTSGNGVAVTSYRDDAAPAPTQGYAAPVLGSATMSQTDKVTLTWTAPSQPLGAAVGYRVSAVNAAGEGALSSEATGRRAAAAIAGYEVEVTVGAGTPSWVSTGSTATTWQHLDAPLGAIVGGVMGATQGTHRGFVRLTLTGATVSAGATVGYRVRGALVGGGVTPTSASRSGRRAVGSLSVSWERSAGTTSAGFAALAGGVGASFDDVGAPATGEKRWYQARLSAAGAAERVVGPLEGWRLAFVSVEGEGGEYGNTCALTPQGTYWCWGEMWAPMMGVPFAPERGIEPKAGAMPAGVQFGSLWGTREPWEQGHMFNCAQGGGDIYCWGDNYLGTLGDGTFTAREAPVRVVGLSAAAVAFGVSVGGAHACAVVDNTGRVQCWGKNSDYQLGRGTAQSKSATPVTVLLSTGSELTDAVEVKAGGLHSCARRAGGTVACWGRNQFGQLGSAALNDVKVDTVAGLTGVVELSLGRNHSCARLQGGTVKCWGAGYGGVLGDGFTQDRTSPVSVIGVSNVVQVNANCARRNDGSVLCWGGEFGATPVLWQGLTGATWVGSAHHWEGDARCVIVDGGIRCWRNPSQAPYDVPLP